MPVLALVAILSWGFASSVGSSPDDDFHLSSIWCGQGERDICGDAVNEGERSLYRDLMIDAVCNAFNAEASASCQGEDFGQNPDDVVETGRGNFDGLYPPVFYFVMSTFATEDIETSVLVMRSANAVIFVGFVSLLFWLLPLHRRQTLVWAIAVTIVPLGIWLIPSTNPSSWAILSAATLWVALLGMFESAGRRRIALGAMAGVAVVIGAGARADAALYAGLSILLVLLLVLRRNRALLWPTVVALAFAALAGVLFLGASQSSAATEGLGGPGGTENPAVLAIANLINVPALWAGIYGSGFGLGWLDTAMPAAVWFAGVGSLIAVLFVGIAARVPRKLIAVVVLLIVIWLYPTYLLVQSQSIVGANFQPRYLLPLLVVMAGFLLLQTPERPLVVTRIQVGIVVVALSFANALALHMTMRRYLTGTDVAGINLDADVEWWWNIPVSPMAVWIIGSLAFAGAMVGIASKALNTPAPGATPGAVVVVTTERA